MIRPIAVLAMTGLVLAAAPLAGAEPADGSGDKCTFTISAPAAVNLPGPGNATGVSATFTWTSCTGLAFPANSAACVSSPASNGKCAKGWGWSPATAIFPTQHPGGQYRATGTACYRAPWSPTTVCETATASSTI